MRYSKYIPKKLYEFNKNTKSLQTIRNQVTGKDIIYSSDDFSKSCHKAYIAYYKRMYKNAEVKKIDNLPIRCSLVDINEKSCTVIDSNNRLLKLANSSFYYLLAKGKILKDGVIDEDLIFATYNSFFALYAVSSPEITAYSEKYIKKKVGEVYSFRNKKYLYLGKVISESCTQDYKSKALKFSNIKNDCFLVLNTNYTNNACNNISEIINTHRDIVKRSYKTAKYSSYLIIGNKAVLPKQVIHTIDVTEEDVKSIINLYRTAAGRHLESAYNNYINLNNDSINNLGDICDNYSIVANARLCNPSDGIDIGNNSIYEKIKHSSVLM